MSLSADTRMGRLELRTKDMGSLFDFYTRGVGLQPISDEPGAVTLGLGQTPVVRLTESPDLRPAAPGSAGLFHTAVLFDSPALLAGALDRMARNFGHTSVGSGDHLVSEAFYFTDPEGNGVELYRDRPREDWRWVDGQVQMDTLFIDPNEYLSRHFDESSQQPAEGELGHVHLQVGDVATARRFYVDVLGFDQTATLGNSALFVSAGGYHHHMAMNVWNSRGAGPRSSTLGLGVVDITLGSTDELDAVATRLADAMIVTAWDGRTITVKDPWRNEIRLAA